MDKVIEKNITFPSTISKFKNIEIEFKEYKSWGKDISNCKNMKCLPRNARKFIEQIRMSVNYNKDVKISHIGVGPARNQIIENIDIWKDLNGF